MRDAVYHSSRYQNVQPKKVRFRRWANFDRRPECPSWVDAVEKGSTKGSNTRFLLIGISWEEAGMMGRRDREQGQLFYEFNLDNVVPKDHLLRRMNTFVTAALADLHQHLRPFYSDFGRPSVDPELMIRMLIVGYCYGIRSERRLCEEVKLHLAYRWFCKLDLDDTVPHHSTFSINRLDRFRESDILRHIFERVVAVCMANGLVKGEGFAVDASVMEANASRYHGQIPPARLETLTARSKRFGSETTVLHLR